MERSCKFDESQKCEDKAKDCKNCSTYLMRLLNTTQSIGSGFMQAFSDSVPVTKKSDVTKAPYHKAHQNPWW